MVVVSTHSRLKAAGTDAALWLLLSVCCFNTQPPEGGWASDSNCALRPNRFNTQPPEGGWQLIQARVAFDRIGFQHTAA